MIILGGEDPITDDWSRMGRAIGTKNTALAWVAPGAERLEAFDVAETEYKKRVTEFIIPGRLPRNQIRQLGSD
jgi:hypothetical protein